MRHDPGRRLLLASAAGLCMLKSLGGARAAEWGAPPADTFRALALTGLDEAGLRAEKVERFKIGDLPCPTGRIVACDPLTSLSRWTPFAPATPAGAHPIFVYVDVAPSDWGRRTTLAELRVSDEKIVRWNNARLEGARPDGAGDVGYPVDAGMGCFCDAAFQDALTREEDRLSAAHQDSYGETVLLDAALKVGDGAQHRFAFDDKAAIALFPSGFGDGVYASYFGFDADGRAARLVTSFLVYEQREASGGKADCSAGGAAAAASGCKN